MDSYQGLQQMSIEDLIRFQRQPEPLYRVPQLVIPTGKHRIFESLS